MSWQECAVVVSGIAGLVALARFVLPLVLVPPTLKASALKAANAELTNRIELIEANLMDRRGPGLPTNLGRRG